MGSQLRMVALVRGDREVAGSGLGSIELFHRRHRDGKNAPCDAFSRLCWRVFRAKNGAGCMGYSACMDGKALYYNTMGKITLAYWDFRGRAEPARMMLEYAGFEWEDKRYALGGPDRGGWPQEKESLGLDFPNLPYLIDGDVRMSESWAIYRYIAKKAGLYPTADKELREADMLEGVLFDLIYGIVMLCHDPKFEDLKAEKREKQSEKMARVEKFLEGRKYLTGSNLSYVDFIFYDTIEIHRLVYTDLLNDFPKIKDLMERFEKLDRIDAYFKSDRYQKSPIYSPIATWGGKK